jgi:glycosyltransferase involved in cell wall biosynthesis
LGALCALFINKSKTKLVVHWHSDVLNKSFISKLIRPLEILLLWRANCILATSQNYVDSSNILKKFINKVSVVPIGVRDEKGCDSKVELPKLIKEKINNRRIILAVGRLVPYKGFDVLIESAKFLTSGAVVVIVGGGPMLRFLQDRIDDLKLSGKVILTNRLESSTLQALFKQASIYCLSSINRAEAFGVVLLEGMSNSLPIVATKISGSGVSWVNQHLVSGLNVPVENPIELASACNQILSSDMLYQKLSFGARQRYLSEFTEDLFISRVMKIYNFLLSNKYDLKK